MRCSNFILWLIPAVLLGSCSNKTEKKDAPSIKVSTEILAKDNACLTTTFVGQYLGSKFSDSRNHIEGDGK